MILDRIDSPADLRTLSPAELVELSAEIRTFIVEAVTTTPLAVISDPTSGSSS